MIMQSLEGLLAEKESLEKAIAVARVELRVLAASNSDLRDAIKKQDAVIEQKGQQLYDIRTGNKASLEVINSEKLNSLEKWEKEIEQREAQLEQLMQNEMRFDDLQDENFTLRQSIAALRTKIQHDEVKHVATIHEMNTDMKLTRHQMETTLKRELTSLDTNYQAEAFLKLNDKQKRAMLVNAKLKDEVAIQGIGIANLTVRLENQRHAYEQLKEALKEINITAKAMRQKLGELGLKKLTTMKTIDSLTARFQDMQTEKESLLQQLNASPSIDEIESEISRVKLLIPKELMQARVWKNRRTRLNELLSYLRPVNFEESKGFFDTELFPLATIPLDCQAETTIPPPAFQRPMSPEVREALLRPPPMKQTVSRQSERANSQGNDKKSLNSPRSLQSSQSLVTPRSIHSMIDEVFDDKPSQMKVANILDGLPKVEHPPEEPMQRTPSKPELINGILPVTFSLSQSNQKDQIKLTDIAAARKADKHLDRIFDILKGRESSLLTSINKNGVPMQNIAAWITYEIMKIWRETVTNDEVVDIPILSVLSELNRMLSILPETDEAELEEYYEFDNAQVVPVEQSDERDSVIGPPIPSQRTGRSDGSTGVPVSREPSDVEIHRKFRIPKESIPVSTERAEFEEMWTTIMEEECRKHTQSRVHLKAETDFIEPEPVEGDIPPEATILDRNWFHPLVDPDSTPSALVNDEWMMRKASDNLMDKSVVMQSLELYPPVIGKFRTDEKPISKPALPTFASTLSNQDDVTAMLLTKSPTSRTGRRLQTALIDPLAPKRKESNKSFSRKAKNPPPKSTITLPAILNINSLGGSSRNSVSSFN